MSKPGIASSIKETAAAILPLLPLYILVIKYADAGAQNISDNSPKPGIAYDSNPIASKSKLSANFVYSFLTV